MSWLFKDKGVEAAEPEAGRLLNQCENVFFFPANGNKGPLGLISKKRCKTNKSVVEKMGVVSDTS